MKIWRLPLIIFLLVPGVIAVKAQNDNQTIKVMTWNIRLDTPDDGDNQWKHRKNGLSKEINAQAPDILGVQEAMNNQMEDLNKSLKGYRSLGVARDDGKKGGEFSALFYRKNRVKPVRSGTFWLSDTPDVPGSRGWDAACNRIVTWAEFKNKRTGKHFMVYNTHFDHIGEVARVESAQLINRKIKELSNRLPVILTGDFNVSSKHRAYAILTHPENEYVLVNTRSQAREKEGPDISWVSFTPEYDNTDLIDFIFTTYDFEVLSNTIFDFRQSGKFLSDHLPVTAVLKFK